jgi:signal transduction histidine kinase/ActR/RegA family two-component response regulator
MSKNFIDRLVLPAVISLTTVIFALMVLQRQLTQQQAEVQASTKTQALLVKNKLESELKARILPLELLRERWSAQSELDFANMESDSALAMSGYPTYQAIEWLDPTYHVQWVVPREGNGGDLGADMGPYQRRREALEAAKESGQVEVTRSVDLRQGGRGFLVCVPVTRNGKLIGFVLGVFRDQELLDSILRDVAPGYWITVSDGNEQIYSRMGATPPREDAPAQEEAITFQQLAWHAQIWPAPEKAVIPGSVLPLITFVGGLVMATWLAVTAYMAGTARLRAQEVAAANTELKREIAGREKAEEALRDAQKMEAVGRLAGGVAHDFNNMLMVIRSHAELSLEGLGVRDPLRWELTEIVRASDRASSLTRQLLAFGRKQVLQPRVLNLNSLVSQVAELLPPVLGVDIKLVLDLAPDLGRVRADSSQIEQVMMNLVFNARDAMTKGGELRIRTENAHLDKSWIVGHPEARPGPHVLLSVRDTGCGMDQEIQSHIFEPFFTTKDRTKGTGLGLASVYGTVHQSGGFITVSSKPGEGTIVQIYLPRVEGVVEVVEIPRVQTKSPQGAETVLVVEDDDAVRRMTRMILNLKGYNVVEARSAAEAIHIMEEDKDSISLVLTDVMMPGMKGQELGERLTKLHRGVRLLYMSAYTEDAILNDGILRPGTAFIEKPFSPEELARKVREVLGTNIDNHGAHYAAGA